MGVMGTADITLQSTDCLFPPLEICEKKPKKQNENQSARAKTIPHLIPMVYNVPNKQIFQSTAIKIKSPHQLCWHRTQCFQVLLIAG